MAETAGLRAPPAGGAAAAARGDGGTLGRIAANWAYGGALAALVLVALTPVLAGALPTAVLLAYLGLPAYMLHQLEEHDGDRFRQFVNAVLGPARRGLTVADVFVINIAGVWATFTAALLAAALVASGWGVFIAWALLVNGLVHVAQAVRMRRYNPGLATSVLLFLPLGAVQLAALAGEATLLQQAVGLGGVLAIHAAIVVLATRPSGRTS